MPSHTAELRRKVFYNTTVKRALEFCFRIDELLKADFASSVRAGEQVRPSVHKVKATFADKALKFGNGSVHYRRVVVDFLLGHNLLLLEPNFNLAGSTAPI